MEEPQPELTEEERKKARINLILILAGLAVIGSSFLWHIASLFFR